jgi:predicted ATPase/class 3 adenylate cyclase
VARETRTFLAADIEGSTRRWTDDEAAMSAALSRFDAAVSRAVAEGGGDLFKHTGDGFFAAFPDPAAAIAAALAVQRDVDLPTRMAVATGAAEHRDDDWFGTILSRTARLMDAGSGGQVLVGEATANLARTMLPDGAGLRSLGAHRFRDLHEPYEVFQLVHPDLPDDFPPIRSLEAFPNNLPVQMTSFVGRSAEVEAVLGLLEGSRLVTLTGVGGVGKTRLALAVAAATLDRFPGGAWFVELAPVVDPSLIATETMTAMGAVADGREPTQIVIARCAEPTLLLLDNCEHLIDDVAKFAENILRGAPDAVVLATSREGLGVVGETLYRVPSLRGDQGLEDAVDLFASRARQVSPDFVVDESNRAAVEQICRRLDGIPLAIELATARLRVLDPAGIAERLDDRFRFLTGGARTALPRQRTLAATMDWSYDLLSEKEQAMLQRLAVFAGTFSLEAAEAVCADDEIADFEVIDVVDRLVAASLVTLGERGRFRMLETVRQYAVDKLAASGEMTEWRRRHAGYFAGLAGGVDAGLLGPEADRVLRNLISDHDNFRLAMTFALESGNSELAGTVADGLYRFWQSTNNWAEAREWYQRVWDGLSDGPLKGWVANDMALCLLHLGYELDEGRRWVSEFDRLVPEPVGSPMKRVQWHVVRGNVLSWGDDLVAAYEAFLEAVDLAEREAPEYTVPMWMATFVGSLLATPRRFDDVLQGVERLIDRSDQDEHLAVAYSLLALGASSRGDWASVRSALEGLARHLPDVPNQATAPYHAISAELAVLDGDLDAGRSSLAELRKELEDDLNWSINAFELGARIELRDGNPAAALRGLEAGLADVPAYQVINAVPATARALAETGEHASVAALLASADAYVERWGLQVFPWHRPDVEIAKAAAEGVEPDASVFRFEVEHREETRRALLAAVRRALANLDG